MIFYAIESKFRLFGGGLKFQLNNMQGCTQRHFALNGKWG